MTCWVLIPIKATSSAKSRLSGALEQGDRERLVTAMLEHVFAATSQARAVSRTLLVGASRLGLPDSVELLPDPGKGLNPAVQSAFAHIAADKDRPDRVLIVAADLPQVTGAELDLLAVPPERSIAIAPDRHETGTNAISLPLPAAAGFRFAFGEDSFSKHKVEAERLGLDMEIVLGHGLERDVDEPDDLAHAMTLLGRD